MSRKKPTGVETPVVASPEPCFEVVAPPFPKSLIQAPNGEAAVAMYRAKWGCKRVTPTVKELVPDGAC